MPNGLKLAMCDRCKKVYVVNPMYEEFFVCHEQNHGQTVERVQYHYCEPCRMALKAWHYSYEQEK